MSEADLVLVINATGCNRRHAKLYLTKNRGDAVNAVMDINKARSDLKASVALASAQRLGLRAWCVVCGTGIRHNDMYTSSCGDNFRHWPHCDKKYKEFR